MRSRKEDKCRSCIFKAKRGTMHKCDYASLTGHTRMAVPPEKCVNYVPNNAPGAKTRAPRTKPDWEAAMALYKRGLNDVEIAEQIGCSKYTVYEWRKRTGLHANCGKGKGNRKNERAEA